MIHAVNLKTEYLLNPIGIDITSPRLMWNVADGIKQSAYVIQLEINGDLISTGDKIETGEMSARITTALNSRDIVSWRVKLYDESGEAGPWSEPAFFEMGLLQPADWKAKWIMGNYVHSKKKKVRYPVDCFKKEFQTPGGIVKARLYITANGVYEAKLNGKRVGNQYFTPGSTNYDVRTHYQSFDVKDLLSAQNTMEIELGDGWYASKAGVFGGSKVFGYEPKLLAQLEITDDEGNRMIITSDNSFTWSNDGPICYADMKDGEIVEAWRKPTYSSVALETSYNGVVCCSNNVPVVEKERLRPEVIRTPDGQTVLDFKQNIAGYVEFFVKAPKGHKITMVMGEKLNDEGNFTIKNISYDGEYTKSHLQKIEYICSGNGEEYYKPKFSIQGFQYALVQNWPGEVKPDAFTAIAVYSDMEVTAEFNCSNEGINKIVENTLWSVKGNFMDVPTDCPTRERAAWTGDAQLFFDTGTIFMDQAAFYRKWMRDVCDEQAENGLVYNITPRVSNFRNSLSVEGSSGWGDAIVLIPYRYWKRYGDDSVMKEHYDSMVRWIEFFMTRLGKYNIFSFLKFPASNKHRAYIVGQGRHFGEWSEPKGTEGKMALLYPRPEEASAYLAYSLKCLAEMAEHLGKHKEAGEYAEISQKIKEAYQHYFISKEALETERMAKLVRPVALDLVNDKDKGMLVEKLVELTRRRKHKIGTGFLSTPFVLGILSEYGYTEDAWRMLTQPDNPGWMYQVINGATTMWENWTPDASLNHYSKGACCEWLFSGLCGINTSGQKNHFVIKPTPCSELNYAKLTYSSVYGKVTSGWEIKGHEVTYIIKVPGNCTADIRLPDGNQYKVGSGTYEYVTTKVVWSTSMLE
ncbi:family 78 glycoside hydrolase catalytic domain [Paenibacillus sp. FSL R7-0204]|uniref:family 78 glycoside hydrolase catalytic domain n=1 Tax=Paenibacillus sp. FSL R7-0204 TaxID=2921675 RepID=UPI0030FB7871